jgi:flavodoxin
MGRWIAIGTAPGWDNFKKFGDELHETDKWRPDARTTVTTVFALGDGRLMAECHAIKQESFEDWLKQKGWTVESITPIKHLPKTGSIWQVK